MNTEAMLAAVRAYVAANYPDQLCTEVRLKLTRGKIVLPMPTTIPAARRLFIPTQAQQDILEALDGKALTGDALAAKLDVDRRGVMRSLAELREHGLVENRQRVGYYRPDAPPPELDS